MGSGRGKTRRTQSVHRDESGADEQNDGSLRRLGFPLKSEETLFYDLEVWCSKQSDPMQKRRIMSIFALIEFSRQSQRGSAMLTEAAEGLKNIMQEDEEDKRMVVAAIIAIAQLRVRNALPELATLLEETEEPHIKEAIALAYGHMRLAETKPQLEQLKTDSNAIVRKAASWSISVLPSMEEAEEQLVGEFKGFINQVSADDFVKYDHYHNED